MFRNMRNSMINERKTWNKILMINIIKYDINIILLNDRGRMIGMGQG